MKNDSEWSQIVGSGGILSVSITPSQGHVTRHQNSFLTFQEQRLQAGGHENRMRRIELNFSTNILEIAAVQYSVQQFIDILMRVFLLRCRPKYLGKWPPGHG